VAKIYKTTDRLTYKIDDITFKISPLSMDQKVELQEIYLQGQTEKDIKKTMEGTVKVLQYALKDIKGVEDNEGNAFELEFDSGVVTRECVENLLNIEHATTLIQLCSSFVGGVPSQLPEGVKAVPMGKSKSKK